MNLVTIGVSPSSSSPLKGTETIVRILVAISGADIQSSSTLADVLYFTLIATDEQCAELMEALQKAELKLVSAQALPLASPEYHPMSTA